MPSDYSAAESAAGRGLHGAAAGRRRPAGEEAPAHRPEERHAHHWRAAARRGEETGLGVDHREQHDRADVREAEPDVVVGPTGQGRSADLHQEDQSGAVQAVGPDRRDARPGREDDVRPAPEGDGPADQRGPEEAGRDEEVHAAASGDGLQQVQIQLKWRAATTPGAFFVYLTSIKTIKWHHVAQLITGRVFLDQIHETGGRVNDV